MDLKQGGFRVELLPADNGPEDKPFATISLEEGGWWVANRDQIRAVLLLKAIDLVDNSYGRYRQSRDAKASQLRQQRDQRNELVAEEWQSVLDFFGPDTPTEE